MKRFTKYVSVFLLCLPATAGEWTIDDLLLAESASDVQLSRDGKAAVWVKSQIDKEKGAQVSNLVLKNLAEDFEIRLTRGKDRDSSPKFSPDGKHIAFLSTRKLPGDREEDGSGSSSETGPQIWLIDTRGGEPWPLTRLKKGVKSLDWLDNDTLLLAAPEDPSLYEQEVKKRKDTSVVVDDEEHAPPVRLFRFELKGEKTIRLTENDDRIEALAVSPDGAWAVTRNERSLRYDYDQKVKPATFLHDLKRGTSARLFAEGHVVPVQIAWDPDSKGFYFSAKYSNDPNYDYASIQLLYYHDIGSGKTTQIDLDWENGLSYDFAPTRDGFLALLANGAKPRLACYAAGGTGWTRAWVETDHAGNVFALVAGFDGRTVLYSHSTASTPWQWFVANLEGTALRGAKPVTALNQGLQKKTIAKSELVYYRGALDEQVEGILYYPHGYVRGRKYPLVVMLHGGPAGIDADLFRDSWSHPVNLIAQKGAFVFKPNYHGSTEYGLKWVESIGGGLYNELEWVDVEKGVDFLIGKGLADPERLGVMGWSNGAIITIELTTRTARYKVASAGAGDVNWLSDWGNAAIGHAFDHYYLGKTPLEDPEYYVRKSPFFRMDKVRTPTIIFFGTEDKQVPTEQGWQHFRALQHLGNTGVRFVLFPGEGHGLKKLAHLRRKLEEELAWFDRHLFGTLEKNESLKPASPLAGALLRSKIGKVPETVRRGNLEIGRFEVTRAQYAAFDASYKPEPGTEHYPASGVSFEDARRYCEWLSRTTGRRFRLGTETEMSEHLKPSQEENTLDRWAGYRLNADDAKRLAPLVAELGPGALLAPVGSLTGSGEDSLFDLGGNVAEWVVAEDGGGKALGGSADRPADLKSTAPPQPDYTGFRVVCEL